MMGKQLVGLVRMNDEEKYAQHRTVLCAYVMRVCVYVLCVCMCVCICDACMHCVCTCVCTCDARMYCVLMLCEYRFQHALPRLSLLLCEIAFDVSNASVGPFHQLGARLELESQHLCMFHSGVNASHHTSDHRTEEKKTEFFHTAIRVFRRKIEKKKVGII